MMTTTEGEDTARAAAQETETESGDTDIANAHGRVIDDVTTTKTTGVGIVRGVESTGGEMIVLNIVESAVQVASVQGQGLVQETVEEDVGPEAGRLTSRLRNAIERAKLSS